MEARAMLSVLQEQAAAVKRRWYRYAAHSAPYGGALYRGNDKRQQQLQQAYRRWMREHQRDRKTSESRFRDARPCYWSLVSCY